MTETNPPAVPARSISSARTARSRETKSGRLTLAESIAQQIDWTPTCLPGAERATIVRQVLDLDEIASDDDYWLRIDALAASAAPDAGQAREPHRVLVYGENDRSEWQDCDGEDCETCGPSGDTVQAPDEAALPGFLQMQDAIEGALRGAGHDLADMADVVYVATEAVRALLGTDTTPDRLAWIDTAAETAAAERQARYQETACARRPAEERPDA